MLLRVILGAIFISCSKAVDLSAFSHITHCEDPLKSCLRPYDPHGVDNDICIPKAWFCDGDDDCPNSFDEDEENCPTAVIVNEYPDTSHSPHNNYLGCPYGSFRCDYACLPNALDIRCDGKPDCYDGNDEHGCAQVVEDCFKNGKWPCGDGTCIEVWHICDGIYHCADHRDEPRYCPGEPSTASTTVETWTTTSSIPPTLPVVTDCGYGEVRCPSSFYCINHSHFCDGTRHCPLGEDEFGCDYKSKPQSLSECIESCLDLEQNCTTTTHQPATFPVVTTPTTSTTTTTTYNTTTTTTYKPAAHYGCPSNLLYVCDKCMYVGITPTKTWEEARDFCVQNSMRFFRIDSGNCFIEVVALLNNTNQDAFTYWVGANDRASEGVWVWEHHQTSVIRGTPLWSISSYGDTYVQQPQGGIYENCASLENCPSQYLNDKSCSENFSFLCEKEAHILSVYG